MKDYSIIISEGRVAKNLHEIIAQLEEEQKELKAKIHNLENDLTVDQAKIVLASTEFKLDNAKANELQFLQDSLSKIEAQLKTYFDNIAYAKETGKLYLEDNIIENVVNLIPQVIFLKSFESVPDNLSIELIKQNSTAEARVVFSLMRIGELEDFSILDEDIIEIFDLL